MARISIPTTARLQPSLRIDPASPIVARVLNRLSRPSLLSLAISWVRESDPSLSAPFLQDGLHDEDDDQGDFYPAMESPADLQEYYEALQDRKGSKREVIDRILEGDWRHGLTLYQLAMADLQSLYDHPTSLKWSAYRIVPLRLPSATDAGDDQDEPVVGIDRDALIIPRAHPTTFIQNLQALVPPDVKAHYNLEKHKDLALLILRIFILVSPYNTSLAAAGHHGRGAPASPDSSLTLYIAFPDAAPFVYISKSQSQPPSAGPSTRSHGESKTLLGLLVEAIPKALSRRRERYTLRSTQMSTRNLAALLHRRGNGRTNHAGGGWSIYADEKTRKKGERRKGSPLDLVVPAPALSQADERGPSPEEEAGRKRLSPRGADERRAAKRRRLVAQARFGHSAQMNDGLGVERVDIAMQDPFPGDAVEDDQRDGGERNDVEGEEEENEGGNGAGGRDRAAGRRRPRGGRRSTLDEAFQENTEAREQGTGGGWCPEVRLTLHGSHVFAGLRQLVEAGIVDGERMPAWMTGESGVTIGAVKDGRLRGIRDPGLQV